MISVMIPLLLEIDWLRAIQHFPIISSNLVSSQSGYSGGIVTEETIFSKIIRKEIPSDIVYEDESILAFRDITPQAPVHFLIIPKKVIPTVNDVTSEDEQVLGRLFLVAAQLAKEHGVDESGYRLSVNCNSDGRQEVFHVHMHLMGGRQMQRMG